MATPIDIGSRRELFVDRLLVERLDGATLKLHEPQPQPLAQQPLTGAYLTVLKEGGRFPLTLIFEKAGRLEVEVPVKGATAMGPSS